MGQVSDNVKAYLLKFKHRLIERIILNDVIMNVRNRTMLGVFQEEYDQAMRTGELDLDLVPKLTFAKYDSTLALKTQSPSIEKNVEDWCKENNLTLVRRFPKWMDTVMTFRFYNIMPPEKRQKADEQSVNFYGFNCDRLYRLIAMEGEMAEPVPDVPREGDIVRIFPYGKNDDSVTGNLFYIDKLSHYDSDASNEEGGNVPYSYHLKLLNPSLGDRLVSEIDTMKLMPGDLDCVKAPIETTFGRFLVNLYLLDLPFHGAIPYVNDVWDVGDVEKFISAYVVSAKDKELAIDQLQEYENNLFYLGQYTEMCVPTYSRKSFSTDPRMKAYRQQLLKEAGDTVSDPRVLMEIENKLIQMDKDYLKGDSSMRFYTPIAKKAFGIARKRMFGTGGVVEAFERTGGNYEFIENSLSEGWDKEKISTVGNEIRRGSFNRGHQTALGGAQTKYMTRVFQDFRVVDGDCGTRRGLVIDLRKHDILKELVGQEILVNGRWTLLTPELLKQVSDVNEITLRTPMYCKSTDGICEHCAGSMLRLCDTRAFNAMTMEISSTFLTASLKAMHGTTHSSIDISDLSKYII